MASITELAAAPHLAIYATGSYGRREASQYSDLDLFFVAQGEQPISKICKTLIDAELIRITREVGLPEFSGDGQYLEIHSLDSMKKHLGTRRDDYENLFTARLLLLLESVPVCHDEAYDAIVKATVDTYFRDFSQHESDFRPLFLLNDIVRFWRTVCLNYESGRAAPDTDEVKYKARVKNLKLKFSRSFTCFSAIMHLVQGKPGISPDGILEVVRLSPAQRIESAAAALPGGDTLASAVFDEYGWFLEQTGREVVEVVDWMRDEHNHATAMEHADRFGEALYRLVFGIAENAGLSRYLVV